MPRPRKADLPACPSCTSTDKDRRGGTFDVTTGNTTYCQDSWHDQERTK